jgi:hypothetical protein
MVDGLRAFGPFWNEEFVYYLEGEMKLMKMMGCEVC